MDGFVTQAPMTTSLLSLSSSDDDSPYRESEVISSLPLPDDDGDDIVVLETESVELLTRKNSETKVVTKQVSIEQVFSRKKKADASLNLEGMEDFLCCFALRLEEQTFMGHFLLGGRGREYQFMNLGEYCSTVELLKACI